MITIVVLLILAGVSIATLTGENGILTQANNARVQTNISYEKEQIELALIDLTMNNLDYLTEKGKSLLEKDINHKIISISEEYSLGGNIIELENGNKYLITNDRVEYI